MEQRNDTHVEASNPPEPRKELTPDQRQRRMKLVVYPLMAALFAGAMWWIYAPSASDREAAQQQAGFNTDVPAPANKQLVEDKQTAYEQESLERKQAERRTQMQDLAALFGGEEASVEALPSLEEPPATVKRSGGGTVRSRENIRASNTAYNDINRTLGSFYEPPKEDPEKEEMREQLEALQAQLEATQVTPKSAMDDQIALMEKSYELAAKYLPGGQPMPGQSPPETTSPAETKPADTHRNGKAVIASIGEVRDRVVSGLAQSISDSDFLADWSQERNMGFHTAVGTEAETEKNTIRACVHDNQTITDGQAVRLRLLEPMRAGETTIPRNALVTGMGKIAGERLGIAITSLEYEGLIIPVELLVIDSDGQQGIFIPGSMEIDALREIAANLGGNLGTTINLNQQSAGNQLLTELGKGTIQGTSQYIAKKMRTVKVHLKAGYRVMLYQGGR